MASADTSLARAPLSHPMASPRGRLAAAHPDRVYLLLYTLSFTIGTAPSRAERRTAVVVPALSSRKVPSGEQKLTTASLRFPATDLTYQVNPRDLHSRNYNKSKISNHRPKRSSGTALQEGWDSERLTTVTGNRIWRSFSAVSVITVFILPEAGTMSRMDSR